MCEVDFLLLYRGWE